MLLDMNWYVVFGREFEELKIDYTRLILSLFLYSINNTLFYLNIRIRKLENINFNGYLKFFSKLKNNS